MSDDEKKGPESDPWANLEPAAAGDAEDGFAFAFEDLEADSKADGPGEDAGEIPLSVFPRPEADADDGPADLADPFEAALAADAARADVPGSDDAGGDADAGAAASGIIAIADITGAIAADAADALGAEDPADAVDAAAESLSGVLSAADVFDERRLAGELAADAGATTDFGDQPSDSGAEDVSFHAGASTSSSPFADAGGGGMFAGLGDAVAEEAGAEEAMTLPMAAGMAAGAAATAAVAAPGKPAAAPRKPAAAPQKGSGIGQLVGIILGGLLAFPIAFAILIWGFQKDPFKFARQAPPQLAFLFPEKLRTAPEKPARKTKGPPAAGPNLSQARSLDDIPGLAGGDAPAAAAAGDAAEQKAAAADPGPPADLATTEPAADEAAAKPEMKPDDAAPAIPLPDALAALDTVEPAPAAAPALPPLDLAGVQAAAAKAADAFAALSSAGDAADPGRRRLLVGWYRQLARLGEELALLESAAMASGRPLEAAPEEAAAVLDRLRDDEPAVSDVARLATMWITSQKRQSDGVVLVGTVDAVRQVGPYWSTRMTVAGAGPDGGDRGVTAISRLQPAADAGDRVLVSGVMFDGDAVWAVDVRPAAAPAPAAGGGLGGEGAFAP